MSIYINKIKADKQDLQDLKQFVKDKKVCIERIVFFKNLVRIYTY